MSGDLDYGNIMNRAMRGFIKEVLQRVADNGLPGEHHFFITLETMHPDVEIADWLVTRYPEEITIVIQHEYEDLGVQENGFRIVLQFGGTPVALYVPFMAISTFVDPSVEFGLKFDHSDENDDEIMEIVENDDNVETIPEAPMAKDVVEDEAPKHDAEIVSLDQFRK